ncbi:MAG: cytochrome c oxidase subunit 3 family protein [Planctomycetota bacterium]
MQPETAAQHDPTLAHHFESHRQQHEASLVGMWAFLAQEVMFFGGMFLAYTVYRHLHPEAFVVGSLTLDPVYGTINTAVLIVSSLTMALAVRSAQLGRGKQAALWIGGTALAAGIFLVIKGVEYSHKYHDGLIPNFAWHPSETSAPSLEIFYSFYFVLTGTHALHMIVGVALMAVVAIRALRGRYGPSNYIGVEVLGLYWHFVDLVWIFLFPLFYLLGRHLG